MRDLANTQRLISPWPESPRDRHRHRVHHKHLFYVSSHLPPAPPTSPATHGRRAQWANPPHPAMSLAQPGVVFGPIEDVVEHLAGHLACERVLLARVIAADDNQSTDPDLHS